MGAFSFLLCINNSVSDTSKCERVMWANKKQHTKQKKKNKTEAKTKLKQNEEKI